MARRKVRRGARTASVKRSKTWLKFLEENLLLVMILALLLGFAAGFSLAATPTTSANVKVNNTTKTTTNTCVRESNFTKLCKHLKGLFTSKAKAATPGTLGATQEDLGDIK